MTEGVDPPAWRAIYEDLRQKIADGAFPDGQLPSIPRLIRQYDSTEGIVRRAVNELRADRLITGRQGKGYFVRTPPPEEPSAEYREVSHAMERLWDEMRRLAQRVDQLESARDRRSDD